MPLSISLNKDAAPGVTVIDISGTKQSASEQLAAAAALTVGERKGMGGRLALQAETMRLTGLLRRVGEGGHVVVWAGNRDGGPGAVHTLTMEIHPADSHSIQSAQGLKTALTARVKGGELQYLDHPSLGYGGRVWGTAKDLNEEMHVVYYGFIDRSAQMIMEFEMTRDAGDHEPFSKQDLEVVAALINSCTLGAEEPLPAEA